MPTTSKAGSKKAVKVPASKTKSAARRTNDAQTSKPPKRTTPPLAKAASVAKSSAARQLPKPAQTILERIVSKLTQCLDGAPRNITEARSEFMDHDGSLGGQVLDTNPEMDHPYDELAKLYESLFKKAKTSGQPLREIQTQFQRSAKEWRHETRWISASEYKTFVKAAAPLVEELRVALRAHGSRLAKDWDRVSFATGDENKEARLLVLHGDEGRIERKPPADLTSIAKRISEVAQSQGLFFTGGEWDVTSRMEDAEDEIEAAMGVLGSNLT